MGHIFDFLARMPEVEDYSYWDNTDKPEETSEKEWKTRGKVWDQISTNWSSFLSLNIVSRENYYLIDPVIELQKEVIDQRKAV